LVCALASPAAANEYGIFIEDIESADDLFDLLADQEIEQETFDILLALFQNGIDLNTASREAMYGLPNLTYRDVDGIIQYRTESVLSDPSVLVANGVLTDRKFLAIAPFLIVRDPSAPDYATDGTFKAITRWSAEDTGSPPLLAGVKLGTFKHLTAGAMGFLTRRRLDDVRYDPNRGALSAEGESVQIHLPKVFARWETDDIDVIIGSYRVGFGQRLTFDVSNHVDPNGIYLDYEYTGSTSSALSSKCKESAGELEESPCSGEAGNIYVSPDFKWSDRLDGIAAGIKDLPLGPGHVQAYGFASSSTRSIGQYEIYDRAVCEDPRTDSDECGAPHVFNRSENVLDPSSRFSFHTLPNLFRETTLGANTTYFATDRVHFGVTGYSSSIDWLPEGMDLDFQEWATRPYGGAFGAVGFDMTWGHKWADVFFEASHSFDSMNTGGGGPAMIVRGTGTWGKKEVEASFRYYDQDFANPYARPIRSPDEFDGNSARDEVGFRVRYSGVHDKRLHIRSLADIWVAPSEDIPEAKLQLRVDLDMSKKFRWGVWTEYRNKDLENNGRETSVCEGSSELTEAPLDPDDPFGEVGLGGCRGEKYMAQLRATWKPNKKYIVSGDYRHELLDDGHYDNKFRQDTSVTGRLTFKPAPEFRIQARTRYKFDAVRDNEYLEQSLWSYLDFAYRLGKKNRFHIRYDLFVWLDERSNTSERIPSPEHRLWADFQHKF
jgi:hypothetical protein